MIIGDNATVGFSELLRRYKMCKGIRGGAVG
jgi:hypothetical protein